MRKGIVAEIVILSLFVLSGSQLAGAELSSSLELTIPDYTVISIGNLDYVEIPEGDILLEEEGRPSVPFYAESIDYPQSYRIQNVTLEERGGLTTTKGLKLPVVVLSPTLESPVEMKGGWYPEKEYEWSVWGNPDGTTTVVIIVYPFYYNPETTDVKFYKDYRFDIEYIVSTLAITTLSPDKNIYEPGDEVTVDMGLNNSGEAQDVIVSTVIKLYGTDEIVDSLPLRTLKSLAGDASFSVKWDSRDTEVGYYYAEATLTDTSGNMLDNKSAGFSLQVSETPEKPARPPKVPILYLIIGTVVIAGVVASVLIIRSRKKT